MKKSKQFLKRIHNIFRGKHDFVINYPKNYKISVSLCKNGSSEWEYNEKII